jgi:hypothetical protein
MRVNGKEKKNHALKLSELVVGEWYSCSSWEVGVKARYSPKVSTNPDKFEYSEIVDIEGELATIPDWLRIYGYSRFALQEMSETNHVETASTTEIPWYVYVPNKSSEYPQLEFWRRGMGLEKPGSWSVGQYVKHDRTVHKYRPDNCFAKSHEDFIKGIYVPYLKGFSRNDKQSYCFPFQLKEGDKFSVVSSNSIRILEVTKIVNITDSVTIFNTKESLSNKSIGNTRALKLHNETVVEQISENMGNPRDILMETPIEHYRLFNPHTPGEAFGPGIIPMIPIEDLKLMVNFKVLDPGDPKEITYPKMPNKGIRKIQAENITNITKTI